MTETYIGPECPKCLSKEKYRSNKKCVFCQRLSNSLLKQRRRRLMKKRAEISIKLQRATRAALEKVMRFDDA